MAVGEEERLDRQPLPLQEGRHLARLEAGVDDQRPVRVTPGEHVAVLPEQLVLEDGEDYLLAQSLSRRHGATGTSREAAVSTSWPDSVIRTMSSMRAPPQPGT